MWLSVHAAPRTAILGLQEVKLDLAAGAATSRLCRQGDGAGRISSRRIFNAFCQDTVALYCPPTLDTRTDILSLLNAYDNTSITC